MNNKIVSLPIIGNKTFWKEVDREFKKLIESKNYDLDSNRK